MKAIEPLDPERLKLHQELMMGEATPANVYYLMSTLRVCLIDARILHVGLSNKRISDLVDLFNDLHSSLKILITMYDEDAVGLDLHHACNRMYIAPIAKSLALGEQHCGYALCVSASPSP